MDKNKLRRYIIVIMNRTEQEELIDALNNDNNNEIMNLTKGKIKKVKNDILQSLYLPRQVLKDFHKRLKKYRYCDEMPNLTSGHYIRWISLKDPENITLSNGAFYCDTEIKKKGMYVICRSGGGGYRGGGIFQLKFDECIFFQKLSDQEELILNIIDYLK